MNFLEELIEKGRSLSPGEHSFFIKPGSINEAIKHGADGTTVTEKGINVVLIVDGIERSYTFKVESKFLGKASRDCRQLARMAQELGINDANDIRHLVQLIAKGIWPDNGQATAYGVFTVATNDAGIENIDLASVRVEKAGSSRKLADASNSEKQNREEKNSKHAPASFSGRLKGHSLDV